MCPPGAPADHHRLYALLVALGMILMTVCVLAFSPNPGGAVDAFGKLVPKTVIGALLAAIIIALLPPVRRPLRETLKDAALALLRFLSHTNGPTKNGE